MTQAREKLLAVEDLKVYFDIYPANAMPWTKPHKLKAVDGVSFDIYAGETLGIVGESGCGKSTLARAVIKMVPAEAGQVLWLGQDLLTLSKKKMQAARKDLQMIFQDPLASLNPRMTIGDIIAEPLKTHYPAMPTPERKLKVKEMMVKVGLLPNQINRYPHEFSGGQCQRIGIARALILKPKLIICDEPVSALDVSIQAQIVNLLMDLQAEMGLSLIFIAHDLSIVQHISTRVMVLYLGNVCEITSSEQLYARPRHPYTQALISAVPIPDPEIERNKKLILIEGDLPSPINPPSGCVFRTRCHKVQPKCSEQRPPLADLGADHRVACFYPAG
ncbi:MAG: murein tripeptide/oligopeptide ABC transporter ATP binding protein OppF [Reinekea forsetii]|jgi:oligopeptide transport system ATP-binding protein|uniref:Oligopeptide transport ATP-binding protein OppF n=1 Tax=Reinekea forsetii TaxID=1336806 RepID=A0A2K8KUS5_9GAMM|nr:MULTISPECIES: murein tripeptide/oligopeptide ABC transporter ATP binding protein OppF [Reinekea]ATX77839.1 oligopeptide transport ATP-binding protein OppF [Reinekea forsetii]MDO7643242.1 murein tripeptide/oligopeptide ABC transporter ATP binding protein OppF [Reinekea forsetii]MDO7673893.1 murein tripeptide/oligopeptide ABC transporter ATP binding protein OppF [Reinekea forsetii]